MGGMKNLLNKSLQSFAVYSLLVLVASIPVYFFLIDNIWINEIDENNALIAQRTEIELNHLQLDSDELEKSLFLWNKVQPHTQLSKIASTTIIPDSLYTVSRQNPYASKKDINRFRGLSKTIQIQNSKYLLSVETIIEESEETIWEITKLTFLFYILLIIGFLCLNKWLSDKLWQPFRQTLQQLKSFQLNKQSKIEFQKSDTVEFEQLNDSLNHLIDENIKVFKTQKEFTENASHELQTPLAIIKGKLDLLLQQESITNEQYLIVEEINTVLTRASRINKNLLLLAKMENNQFQISKSINISKISTEVTRNLQSYFSSQKKQFTVAIESNITLDCNATLVEVILNNLLLNTIKHSNNEALTHLAITKQGITVSNSGTQPLLEGKLYTRFASMTKNATSSGLGLAIIKQICEVHGWKIQYTFDKNNHIFTVLF
jgi:signal transduction histidine kinase